ncbi:MAG: zf-HC2 domain-containing protein [Candidatus Hydrogenedentota bacterium]
MSETCDEIRDLMSGYLDDELSDAQTQIMQAHLDGCAVCRQELDEMTQLVAASSELGFELPPEEVWDDFLGQVYARMERRFGWLLIWLGCAGLIGVGLYTMLITQWESSIAKIATEIVLVGLAVVFASVARQRWVIRKTDRYSNDIHH